MAGYSGPFVRCNSIPMYFKVSNGNIVASPMDEDEVEPQDCQTDELRVAASNSWLSMGRMPRLQSEPSKL